MPLLMCPNCTEGMQEVRRNDVQIDICPRCRGVWLDRGELEKLLGSVRRAEAEYERDHEESYRSPHPPGHGQKPYRRKKKSIFEMFDIFD